MNLQTNAPLPLSAKGISRRFGGLVAVSQLDLEIRPREILGLIGPNGAGKSTTFNLLSGFLKPSTGTLSIDGKDVTGSAPSRISRLGLVRTFQHGSLMPTMTVEDNILVGAIGGMPGAGKVKRLQRVHETAELIGISRFLPELAGTLPHGLQRLVSIAIAFAPQPKLLCLDEPLTGLNQTEVATTLDVFRAIRRDALQRLGLQEMTYGWNIEMQIEAARHGLRIEEVPLPYRCRMGGESKVAGSIRGSIRASWRIIATFIRVAFSGKRVFNP